MNRWVRILVVIVVLVGGTLVLAGIGPLAVVRGRLTGEAFFDGRPTTHWRRALQGEPGLRAEAIASLESGGPQAGDVLAALLGDRRGDSAELRWTAAELLGQIGAESPAIEAALIAALADPDPCVRGVAVAAIPRVGIAADIAVPALQEFLRREPDPVSLRVLSEYRAAAQPALPLLVDILGDRSQGAETRWNAARTIGKVGAGAQSAVPALVAALTDGEATVREHAAEALGDIGPPAAAAVADLAAVLTDPATRVRRDAVRSLGQIGPPARAVVPQMKTLLNDPEGMVRDTARNALRAIAPEELPEESPKELPKELPKKPAKGDSHSSHRSQIVLSTARRIC